MANDYTECATSEEAVDSIPIDDNLRRTDAESFEPIEKAKRSSASVLKRFLPILEWLPKYSLSENLHNDVIAGLTVGVMHVPQGMAYASLAALPPIIGLYSSFFASTFYMLFGTARHVSVGCFAVASMMVGGVQMRLLPDATFSNHTMDLPFGDVSPLQLTSALTLTVGVVQFIMAIARLDFITSYLSDPLVSGFTTGAATHVAMSQLNKIFGVSMPRHSGRGMVLYMLRDIVLELPNTNLMALSISIFGIIFLSIGRDYLNPFVKRHSKIPVPLELILVILGTAFSAAMQLKEHYHVKVVDEIPTGFPCPSTPHYWLVPSLLSDAIPISVVCYIFLISMAKHFAKKHKYRVDSTQEMYACSMFSLLSSPFPVYPVGASLSRSAVCEISGAKTLLYTMFSSSLLLTVILFLGPLLEPLPMSVLACIVVVSLKSLFIQAFELPRLYRISKHDFAIWLVACFATILGTVTQGLFIAVAFAILTVVLREQWPSFSDVANRNASTVQKKIAEHVKVLKFDAPLHFANVNRFIDVLQSVLAEEQTLLSKLVIVDCSAIAYVDSMGVDAIRETYLDAKRVGVFLLFAGFNDRTIRVLDSINFFNTVPLSAFQTTVAEAANQNVPNGD